MDPLYFAMTQNDNVYKIYINKNVKHEFKAKAPKSLRTGRKLIEIKINPKTTIIKQYIIQQYDKKYAELDCNQMHIKTNAEITKINRMTWNAHNIMLLCNQIITLIGYVSNLNLLIIHGAKPTPVVMQLWQIAQEIIFNECKIRRTILKTKFINNNVFDLQNSEDKKEWKQIFNNDNNAWEQVLDINQTKFILQQMQGSPNSKRFR